MIKVTTKKAKNEPKNGNNEQIKTALKANSQSPLMSMNDIVSLAWGSKEILRDDFKKTETGKTILPFIVLRRLGRVLESTKDKVLLEYEKIKNEKPEYIEARLNKITGHGFHNHSKYNLELLLADPKSLQKNIQSYIRGFSENVRDIFEKFGFETTLNKLDEHEILFNMVEKFASSELDFDPKKIDNHMMGMIYEEVIRRANEATNEEAGHHFTPREVISLMVDLLLLSEKNSLSKKGIIKTIYDPASGTGGMLSVASDYIAKINPDAIIDTYGQELNDETYAICKSDMLIKGLELDRIKFGNSLIAGKKGDGFYDQKFHYMLSNPPFGVDWGKYERGIRDEEEKGEQGKYGAGTPRLSDGSLLFLLSMISKMKPKEEGGSRIAIIQNGSSLFTGEAGSGGSNIRKWIIENDMLEAIVAIPNNLFYNTPISTYIWIVSNNKDEKRKGKIQLINTVGEEFFQVMRIKLGEKSNKISNEQIKKIIKIYDSFEEGNLSKIFDNEDFGYTRITVDRPLKRNFKVSADRLEKLQQEKAFLKLDELKPKPKQPKCKDVLKVLSAMFTKTYKDHDDFSTELSNAFSKADYKITATQLKTIENSLSERDEGAIPQKDPKGNLVADSDLRDYENIPLNDDIDKYFAKEVSLHVPDAWIDESTLHNIGYEISFAKYFSVFQPLRSLEEINADLKENQKEISKLQKMVLD